MQSLQPLVGIVNQYVPMDENIFPTAFGDKIGQTNHGAPSLCTGPTKDYTMIGSFLHVFTPN
jgi:hypothetical protein